MLKLRTEIRLALHRLHVRWSYMDREEKQDLVAVVAFVMIVLPMILYLFWWTSPAFHDGFNQADLDAFEATLQEAELPAHHQEY